MSLKPIITSKAPEAIGPYSQGIEIGDFIYTSGQIPIDVKTGKLEKDVRKATELCLNNIKAVLNEAGSCLDDVIKVTIFVKSMDDFDEINSVYAEYFSDIKPARSCVEVSKLPKDSPVEIEVVALKR